MYTDVNTHSVHKFITPLSIAPLLPMLNSAILRIIILFVLSLDKVTVNCCFMSKLYFILTCAVKLNKPLIVC